MDPFGSSGFGDPMESVLSLQTFGFAGMSSAEPYGPTPTAACCSSTNSCPGTTTTASCSPEPSLGGSTNN